jgi:integrase
MGYLKRFGERKYRIIYDVLPENGKRRQKRETLEAVTKKQAEAILAQREAEVLAQRKALENGDGAKDEIILSDLFDSFLKQKRKQKEDNTIIRYETLVKLYLKPKFGNMQAKQLKPFHLMAAYSDWLENGREKRKSVSAKTIRHAHELLRNILNWGVRRELLSRNVAVSVEDDDLPKVVQPKPQALTEDELRKLLAEAKSPTSRSKKRGYISAQAWFYPAVAFAVYTGARRGEVLALRWSDLKLEKKSVTIARSLTERMVFKAPKNDKARTIALPDALCSILESHKAVQAEERKALGEAYQDQDLVFARADGSAIDPWNFGRAVLDCIKRAKVTPITLHGLRDTHASLCAKAGVPLEVVSNRLGHASIGVTAARYLHVYSERDAQAASAFDRLLG